MKFEEEDNDRNIGDFYNEIESFSDILNSNKNSGEKIELITDLIKTQESSDKQLQHEYTNKLWELSIVAIKEKKYDLTKFLLKHKTHTSYVKYILDLALNSKDDEELLLFVLQYLKSFILELEVFGIFYAKDVLNDNFNKLLQVPIVAIKEEKKYGLTQFLLKNKIDTFYCNNYGKYILDFALNSKDEELLLFALQYAESFIFKFEVDVFHDYYQKIIHTFPYSNELNKLLEKVVNSYIKNYNHRFERLDSTHPSISLILASLATRDKKASYKNTIFFITRADVSQLTAQLMDLIKKDTKENLIKFQLIYSGNSHTMCYEFRIDKTGKFPKVQCLYLDSVPVTSLQGNGVITSDFIQKISQFADIEIIISGIQVQKVGRECPFFAIDFGRMLNTSPNKKCFVDVIKYIKENSISHRVEKNVTYIVGSSLPPRFLRSLQYEKGLNSLIFDNESAKKTISNETGETVEESIRKNLEKRPSSSKPQDLVIHNLRIANKIYKYRLDVNSFLEKFFHDKNFNELIDQYTIKGLNTLLAKKTENNFYLFSSEKYQCIKKDINFVYKLD